MAETLEEAKKRRDAYLSGIHNKKNLNDIESVWVKEVLEKHHKNTEYNTLNDTTTAETKPYRHGARRITSIKIRADIIRQAKNKNINTSDVCEKALMEALGKKDAEAALQIIHATLKNTIELTDPADLMKNREKTEKTVNQLLEVMRKIIIMIERDVYKK
jgi:post-segregation antitoxin (ccd killing protein)